MPTHEEILVECCRLIKQHELMNGIGYMTHLEETYNYDVNPNYIVSSGSRIAKQYNDMDHFSSIYLKSKVAVVNKYCRDVIRSCRS